MMIEISLLKGKNYGLAEMMHLANSQKLQNIYTKNIYNVTNKNYNSMNTEQREELEEAKNKLWYLINAWSDHPHPDTYKKIEDFVLSQQAPASVPDEWISDAVDFCKEKIKEYDLKSKSVTTNTATYFSGKANAANDIKLFLEQLLPPTKGESK